MKAIGKPTQIFCMILLIVFCLANVTYAANLFNGRQIHLSNEDNRTFKIGVTGTTAGYNFIALIENVKQESISLGDLGYWEMVDDPPSALRNYDLQFNIKNNYKGKFQIEFEYDPKQQDIIYRTLAGTIQVKLDNSEYYPTLIIDHIASVPAKVDDGVVPSGSKRFLFYDFNSFDADMKQYYGSVKRMIRNPDFTHYFYYYESGNYNSYYFKTYRDSNKLDKHKMGLSLENDTLEYYQKVLENLKSHHGTNFADQVVIISRFGKKYSDELKKYAHEIGMSKDMVVNLWSYDDIQ
ncbi:MAG: hypothetical protein KKH68_09040 [Proteobacteria bacterium]|nr:hypothetical protein [Pseudomonadota bacterium]